jgi:hypothetical protein
MCICAFVSCSDAERPVESINHIQTLSLFHGGIMLTRVVYTFVAVAAFAVVSIANAQSAQGLNPRAPGYTDIGFSIADASSDSAGVAWGFKAERLLKQMGSGLLGVNLSATMSSYDFGLGHKWLFIPVGLSATYHFATGSDRFDPFIALGGGYRFVECSQYLGTYADCSTEEGKAFGIARAGAKFFVSNRVGFQLDGGLGSSYVSGGILLRLK